LEAVRVVVPKSWARSEEVTRRAARRIERGAGTH